MNDEALGGLIHENIKLKAMVGSVDRASYIKGLEDAKKACYAIEQKKWSILINGGKLEGVSIMDCVKAIDKLKEIK